MRTERVAPAVGVVGCLAVLLTMAVPYVVAPGWGSELGQYYAAGPLGAAGVAFLALVCVVVFLAGARGRTDAVTAAGIALVVGVGTLLVALSWALSVSLSTLYGFPFSWLPDHRWVVVAETAVVVLAAAGYARAVV
ncbi:MAG: hypothetical protein ABEJ82_06125 [Haloplanus sp.]